MMTVCPHCGHDLHRDTAILINDFSMFGPGAPLYWNGHLIELTGSEATLLFSLMKCYPQPVSSDTLLDRMDSDGSYNTLAVFATRIRKKLRAVGAPIPFVTAMGGGRRFYRWVVE